MLNAINSISTPEDRTKVNNTRNAYASPQNNRADEITQNQIVGLVSLAVDTTSPRDFLTSDLVEPGPKDYRKGPETPPQLHIPQSWVHEQT